MCCYYFRSPDDAAVAMGSIGALATPCGRHGPTSTVSGVLDLAVLHLHCNPVLRYAFARVSPLISGARVRSGGLPSKLGSVHSECALKLSPGVTLCTAQLLYGDAAAFCLEIGCTPMCYGFRWSLLAIYRAAMRLR